MQIKNNKKYYYKDNTLPTGKKLNVTHLPSDNDENFLKVLVKERKQTTTCKDTIVSIQKVNNDDVGLTTSVLTSKDFIDMKISPTHDHMCPNRNNDRKTNSETMESMSSLQPQELYKILDQVQNPTAVSKDLEGAREMTAILDTNTISRKTTNTKEKKKNNNTVREKQVQNTLTVKSKCQHATVNSTNTEHTHDIDSANLRKATAAINVNC